MNISSKPITLSEDDLKEIFSLFTSVTKFERDQIYDRDSDHHFLRIQSLDEYALTEEKREYALDAWRAILYFLHSRGYSLCRNDWRGDLSFIEEYFIS